MDLTMPTLPRNPRIKKAELTLYQKCNIGESTAVPKYGLYQVTGDITTGTCTPTYNTSIFDFDYAKTGNCEDEQIVAYTFDITKLVDQVNKGETSSSRLMLKMIDETLASSSSICIYGSKETEYAPEISITYESSYGVNTSYRTHTHELGRFGQGSVDLQCGNLMFESEDFSWAGNRMPVTIKHLYNSALAGYQYTNNSEVMLNTADFSAMKIGYGWKLNLMQSMKSATFVHDDTSNTGHVYIGENGDETYFKKSSQYRISSSNQCYYLYEDVDRSGMIYDPTTKVLEQGEDKYFFDSAGRLIKITDSNGNSMSITYSSNRITSVTDGAGRKFTFTYDSNGYLTKITAPDSTSINYEYRGDLLLNVIYPDGSRVNFTNASGKQTNLFLYDANGLPTGMVYYTYSGERILSISEYGFNNGYYIGAKSSYSYSAASRRTTVTTTEPKDTDEGETADNVIKTVYTFDDDGNIISEYLYSEDTGNTGSSGGGSGINPYAGEGGAVTNEDYFNMSKSLKMTGGLSAMKYAYQSVTVKTNRSTRETFTLSGWAKGYGIPVHERSLGMETTFRLRAVIQYYDTLYKDTSTETYTADFSPCTEEWQFASIEFSKSKFRTVSGIRVYCDYDYNYGTVFFDDIQLVRNSIETDLSASDFYTESTGDENDEEAEEVVDTTDLDEAETPEFEEVKDNYGNALTETTFTDGEFGTLYRAFGYNEATSSSATDAGNNLISEIDARGNETTYTVEAETSRTTEVTDRLGNRTAYEYDEMGRTTKVTSKNSSGTTLGTVAYTYDSQDNMTSITRGDGMKYELGYNNFGNLESIGINGKSEKLVQYTYKTGNGRLKQVTYANGDYMKASYNSIGQLVAEKWYDSADTLTAHYKYVHDGEGNVVRSIDVLSLKEYNYSYEDGRVYFHALNNHLILQSDGRNP